MKTTIYCIILIFWLYGLFIIQMAHSDLILFWRSEFASIVLNVIFLLLSISCIRVLYTNKMYLSIIIPSSIWFILAMLLGGHSLLLGLTTTPSDEYITELALEKGYSKEWVDKALLGIPVSSPTAYMHKVWILDIYFDLITQTKSQSGSQGESNP